MSRKTMVMIGMVIGSTIGGYLPTLFGAHMISYWGLLGSTIGGIIGIYVAFKYSS
jgi:uncharacterized membrane protein YeaQ/YmgE (transglycosylase-associated protein family)